MFERSGGTADHEPVSSESVRETLEHSEKQFSEVEDTLGLNINGLFHEVRELNHEGEEPGKIFEQIDWAWEQPKRVLEYEGDISKADLAYLAAKGHMKRLDFRQGGEMFPVRDQFGLSRYTEFVANLARSEFEELEITTSERFDLLDAKRDYFQKRGKADLHGYPKNKVLEVVNNPGFDKTKLAIAHDTAKERMDDGEFKQKFISSIKELQDQRVKVGSKLAAKRYAETEEYDVSEFLMPDMKLYHETMDLFKKVESNIESKRHQLRTGDSEDEDYQNT